jgi:phage shock protein A
MSQSSSILSDLLAAGKRLFTSAGEAVVDANAIKIIEQRIRDAQDELNESNEQLASLMAKRKVQSDILASKQEKMEEYGKYITACIEKGNQGLAKETAQKFAELEGESKVIEKTIAGYDNNIANIKERNRVAEDVIKQSSNRIDMLKANEAMIDAAASVSDAHSGAESSLTKALESAEKLEKQQMERIAQIDAAAELASEKSGSSLEKKLEEAGIVSTTASVDDVLARFTKS